MYYSALIIRKIEYNIHILVQENTREHNSSKSSFDLLKYREKINATVIIRNTRPEMRSKRYFPSTRITREQKIIMREVSVLSLARATPQQPGLSLLTHLHFLLVVDSDLQ